MTVMQALSLATEAALRASIARFGVIVPVVVDQHGQVLDGHNRTRIAQQMGVPFETHVYNVANADEARDVARTLNEDRRHMPKAERLKVVHALRADGHSTRAIAGAVGVSYKTAHRDIAAGVTGVTPEPPAQIIGLDGKQYAARKAAVKASAPLGRVDATTAPAAAKDEEWLRLRRLGGTQLEAARQSGLTNHDVPRIVAKHGDPLPKIAGMNAYDMLDAQTRQIDVAATLMGQLVEAIDPAHPQVKNFLLALQKMRTASNNAERVLRRATIRVMS